MPREREWHEAAVLIWRVTGVNVEPVAESGNFTSLHSLAVFKQFEGVRKGGSLLQCRSLAREQKIIEKALSKALLRLKILCEYRKIVNCQTRARNSRSNFPQRKDVMAVSATGFRKSMTFPVFHSLRSQTRIAVYENQYHCYYTVKEQFLKNYR